MILAGSNPFGDNQRHSLTNPTSHFHTHRSLITCSSEHLEISQSHYMLFWTTAPWNHTHFSSTCPLILHTLSSYKHFWSERTHNACIYKLNALWSRDSFPQQPLWKVPKRDSLSHMPVNSCARHRAGKFSWHDTDINICQDTHTTHCIWALQKNHAKCTEQIRFLFTEVSAKKIQMTNSVEVF